MSPIVSVVVPVYNASKYLQQNIESLVNQTLKDIEIIYVDDGSTDNSVEIIESYMENDDRIKLLRQKNLHAGVARNTGMHAAKGKYLIFLDADDFFELEMLKELSAIAEKQSTDMLFFHHNGYDMFHQKVEFYPFEEIDEEVHHPSEFGEKLFEVTNGVTWNKLYLRSFVNDTGIEFQNLLHSNDAFFVRMTTVLANRIAYVKKGYVYYRFNNSESLQGKRDREILCFGKAFLSIKNELMDRGLFEGALKKSYYNMVIKVIDDRITETSITDNIQSIYCFSKEYILPDLSEYKNYLPDNHITARIITSKDYEQFICGEYLLQREKCKDLVPKTSKEYVLGRSILRLPRFCKRVINRINVKRA